MNCLLMYILILLAMANNSCAIGQTTPIGTPSSGQSSDTTRRQVEISGAVYPLSKVLYSQFALGANFHAKKDNWYNNVALSVNIQDAAIRSGAVFAFYSFSVGKNYQHIRGHFYGSAGINAGLFYGNFTADSRIIRHTGLVAIPKLEIGYNFRNTIASTGIYYAQGASYRQEIYFGEVVPQPRPQDYFRLPGVLNLYLKLILK